MEYILVTVKIGKGKDYELKIPAEITAGELVEMIEEAFRLNSMTKRSVHVEPLGRILGADEVLIEEGVYNGSQITLV